MKTRAVQIFEEYIHADKTRVQYMYHLNKFVIHNNLESVDMILSINSEELKQLEKLKKHKRKKLKN